MNFLLDGRSLEQKIEEAKKLLQENGYCIHGPVIDASAVKNANHLVQFFYDQMSLYNPQFDMVYSGSLKKDRGIAKRMIELRVAAGSSKSRAIKECCILIETLFKYEEHLGLRFKVTSMGVFGQESMSWITEKLWQIYEGVDYQIYREDEQLWFDQLYKKQENTINEEDLKKARDKMDRILNKNAKEEEAGRED